MSTTLESALSASYRILDEIGRGGMATVYLADDLRHCRKVAVKVLRPELAMTVGPERFMREIRVAASLSHPHILPLFDSGATAGFLYYVMPFVDGRSLRQRLEVDIQLGVNEALQIVREVASGLSFAHSRGIVHRDVKPENILLAGATAVVSDFGIALLSDALDYQRLTATGMALGTPAYMSPEQVQGIKVDVRSDIYSLGCVLYETLAGQPPFVGATARSVLARHAVDPVPSLRTVRPTIPDQIELALNRALAKVPADRFASVEEFIGALTGTSSTACPIGATDRKSRERQESVAVMPFVNIGSSKDEWLADGMTEELISGLATVRGIRVLARTTSFALKGRYQDVRSIGDALNVGLVVEGSIRKSGRTLRIVVRLIDTLDGRQKWSATYDRQLREVLVLQEELSRKIIDALQSQLDESAMQTVPKPGHPEDTEAYELYLRGRFLWNQRERPALENALSCFERAVSRAPGYAKAHVGIADCYIVLANRALLSPRDAFPRAKQALQMALSADPLLPDGHFSRANVAQSYDWDWDGAEEGFKRGLELAPGYATGRQWYGLYLAAMARTREASAQLEAALHFDPLSAIIASSLGTAQYYARQFDRAIKAFERALELDPRSSGARAGLGEAYLMSGREVQALTELQNAVNLSNGSSQTVARLATAHAKVGQGAEAERMLGELLKKSATQYVPAYFVAAVHANLGRADDACSQLEAAFEERSDWLMDLRVDPAFDVLRDNRTFAALVQRLKLPNNLAEAETSTRPLHRLDDGLTTA